MIGKGTTVGKGTTADKETLNINCRLSRFRMTKFIFSP
jgi:hypothetical protein